MSTYLERLKPFLPWLFAVIAIFLVWYLLVGHKTPEPYRIWQDSVRKTNFTTRNEKLVTIHNVRDWTYGHKKIIDQNWIDEITIDTNQIETLWFLLEPFPYWDAVGHTYLTFELADGNNVSFSVEARLEANEIYSAVQGMFREYELAYTWGTERDFLTRRLLYLDHDVRMYPLALEPAVVQEIFLSLAEQTNQIYAQPRFYNTLTNNCTNVLANEVNHLYPSSIPYDISWNLPGSSDEFLWEQGLIASEEPIDQIIKNFSLAPHRSFIAEIATSSPTIFAASIRSLF